MTRPWEPLDRVETPDGVLELRCRGSKDYLITIGGRVLMTSMAHRSEDALATLGCGPIAERQRANVLVSGLGMGFTLRAALDALRPDARVTVAELNPVVATWCNGPLAPLTRGAVNDPRVQVVVADVSRLIRSAGDRPDTRYDAIVLDMYEGPAAAHISPRDPLYGPRAIGWSLAALTPGGTLSVWSERPSQAFEHNLKQAGFSFERHKRGRGTSVHYVYVAQALQQRLGGAGRAGHRDVPSVSAQPRSEHLAARRSRA